MIHLLLLQADAWIQLAYVIQFNSQWEASCRYCLHRSLVFVKKATTQTVKNNKMPKKQQNAQKTTKCPRCATYVM
uniref:Secreted protein n=1 Tax=Anguilla anguilla TaxID=7936 RepID=A0A0E9WPH6_ANGAN